MPKMVKRKSLCVTATSALPFFFVNMLTQQLIHDLNIPHTPQQHAAVMYTVCGCVTWLWGKLLCFWYYRSSHNNGWLGCKVKCQV